MSSSQITSNDLASQDRSTCVLSYKDEHFVNHTHANSSFIITILLFHTVAAFNKTLSESLYITDPLLLYAFLLLRTYYQIPYSPFAPLNENVWHFIQVEIF